MGAVNYEIKCYKLSEICSAIDTSGVDALFTFNLPIIPINIGFFSIGSNQINEPLNGFTAYVIGNQKLTAFRQLIGNGNSTSQFFTLNGIPFNLYADNYGVEAGSAAIVGAGFVDGAAFLAADSYILIHQQLEN